MNEENKFNEMNPENGVQNNNVAPQTPMNEYEQPVNQGTYTEQAPVTPVPTVEPVQQPVYQEEVKPSIVQENVDAAVEKAKKSKGGLALLIVIVLIIVAVIVFLPQITTFIEEII